MIQKEKFRRAALKEKELKKKHAAGSLNPLR